ncbi:transposase [Burkholderia sp. Nafp2/4-1b]|nr:transposase [Burkholderia sp. Nafp2/4-1b]
MEQNVFQQVTTAADATSNACQNVVRDKSKFEEITDEEWRALAPIFYDPILHHSCMRGRPRADPRVILNAVLWVYTTANRWSQLPARYPCGITCRRRLEEWQLDGTFALVVARLSEMGRALPYEPPPPRGRPETGSSGGRDGGSHAGVFWQSPSTWQSTHCPVINDPLREAAENKVGNGLDPVASTVSRGSECGEVSRECVAGPLRLTPFRDATWVTAPHRYAICVAADRMTDGSYRCRVEIARDGRRIERSGLIGPKFLDEALALEYALDWADNWICRHDDDGAQCPRDQGPPETE